MFAKVFEQILDSSVAENWKTRHVFEDMLKLADVNGVVDVTRESISRRTKVPLHIVNQAIDALEKPDPNSRNPAYEGRRIVLLDEHRNWGWFIVNYQYYRELAREDQRRQRTLARVRKFREKEPVTLCNADVTHANAKRAMEKQMEKQKNGDSVNKSPLPMAQMISLEGELKRICEELKGYTALIDYPNNSSKHKRLSALLARQVELRGILGVVA
jgi:hypothetical protein